MVVSYTIAAECKEEAVLVVNSFRRILKILKMVPKPRYRL
jgi:hypothetical protein